MTKINSVRRENILSAILGLVVPCFTSHIFSNAKEIGIFAFVVILSWFIHKEWTISEAEYWNL